MAEEQKLTKKQLKAQQFKKSKDEREQDKEDKKRQREEEEQKKAEAEAAPKKKRKTRRGKGGKTKKGNRFIVFVGNLPHGTTASQLQAHFKASSPDHIRMRPDKGIAFLEFDGDKDHENIQRRMDVALLQHKTTLADRKINVELTVGGGGNSAARLEKLRSKNEKLDQERSQRMTKLISDNRSKKTGADAAQQAKTPASDSTKSSSVPPGIHPDRARLIK